MTFLVAALPLVATANLDDGLVERARVIHAQSLTLDAHADIEIVGKPSMYVGPDGLSKVAPEKMRDGQLDAVVMALAVGPKPRNEQGFADARRVADDKLRAVTALVEESGNRTRLVKSPDALLASVDQGDRSIVLSLQNALIFGEDLSAIDYFFDQGVRMFALTHMGHNDFADSSRPLFNAATGEREVTAEHGGLSSMGVAAVGRFNALGAVIDVSQLSSAATLQVV
ncbi:dipeptidase, partial [Luminiphilus sp.]|nr:dipeptidase [Luminiphilus sp.]